MQQIRINKSVVELRPMTYSFTNIFRIEAVRQLVLATLFRSMSGSMLFLLNINGSSPLHPVTYVSYVAGGAVSFFIIALCSDKIYRKKTKFLPLMVWVWISIVY